MEMLHAGWCPPFPGDPQLGLGGSSQWHSRTQDLGARATREPSGQKGTPLGTELGSGESRSRL